MPLGIPLSEFLSWDETDQDYALAFMRAKAEVCDRCGTRKSEWDKDVDAYIVDGERCMGCEALELAQEELPTDHSAAGVKLYLRKPTDEDIDPESAPSLGRSLNTDDPDEPKGITLGG